MASLALTHRFRSTWWICVGSAMIGQRLPGISGITLMFLGKVPFVRVTASQQVSHVQPLLHRPDAVRKREDLAHELDAALRALLKGVDEAQVFRVCGVFPQERRGHDDGREDVVEVMRDPEASMPMLSRR
jgi:hypothetical protein